MHVVESDEQSFHKAHIHEIKTCTIEIKTQTLEIKTGCISLLYSLPFQTNKHTEDTISDFLYPLLKAVWI